MDMMQYFFNIAIFDTMHVYCATTSQQRLLSRVMETEHKLSAMCVLYCKTPIFRVHQMFTI